MRHIGDVLNSITIPISRSGNPPKAVEPTYRCPICKDAGYYRLDVDVDHPQFGKRQQCSCRKNEEENRKAGQLLALSNLQMMSNLTFDNFDSTVPGVDDAVQAARAFAADPDGWLLLKGSIGSGKTHLAVAIANELIRRFDTPVLFMVVPDLLDHLRAAFDPSHGVGYDERFEQVRTSPILILDDLGTENATPWAREKLFQIFNYRYNENLPIIVTTNANLLPGTGRSGSQQSVIDERIRSRLLDDRTRYVEMDAEDFRLRKRANQFRQLKR